MPTDRANSIYDFLLTGLRPKSLCLVPFSVYYLLPYVTNACNLGTAVNSATAVQTIAPCSLRRIITRRYYAVFSEVYLSTIDEMPEGHSGLSVMSLLVAHTFVLFLLANKHASILNRYRDSSTCL